GLKNCRVTTRKQLIMRHGAQIVGSKIWAGTGVAANEIGAQQGAETEIRTGKDYFSDLRSAEIQEELSACEMNIRRINQALRECSSQTSMAVLSDERRALLYKLQAQSRTLDLRVSRLHM